MAHSTRCLIRDARKDSDTPDDAGKRAASWTTRMARDHRAQPRYTLTAGVEIVEAKSGVQIEGTVSDLGVGGCHVHTDNPFPVGTVTKVRITKGHESFETPARVASSMAGKSMGLEFTGVEPKQLQVLEKLLAGSLETSWVVSNRRQSQRILMQVAVRVSGYDDLGSSFKEKTHTISISPHGGLLLLSAPVRIGQRLVLSNIQTRAVTECIVVHKGGHQADSLEVGVQFILPDSTFWGVAFPPEDWSPHHPDAKSRP